jgi:hypothetical protein
VVLKTIITFTIIATLHACNIDTKRQYPSHKNYYQKKSIGKFFDKDLIFRNKKNQKTQQLSRRQFWQQIKKKILIEGFEIDFSDEELFFITSKWKDHDKNNQIKINILFKRDYKNHGKNISITIATRIKNNQQQWILSETQSLKDIYKKKLSILLFKTT